MKYLAALIVIAPIMLLAGHGDAKTSAKHVNHVRIDFSVPHHKGPLIHPTDKPLNMTHAHHIMDFFKKHHEMLHEGPLKTRWVAQYHFNRAKKFIKEHSVLTPHDWIYDAFLCIHKHEGAWNANTGNGYYGGLQMDLNFQRAYGSDFLSRWGTADRWPAWAQINAGRRAHDDGRGFGPWPNTARACGLI